MPAIFKGMFPALIALGLFHLRQDVTG